MSGLVARLDVTQGTFVLGIDLAAEPGRTLALVGPNGAGKSTTVNALAGLIDFDAGFVRVDERVLDDVASGVHVETEHRRIGVLFQDYLLFPHLTALDNVAFGLRAAGVSRRDARERASDWLARFGLADLANRRPAELSGGQAQRVALARALAAEPDVLLLDEPLAALDVEVRDDTRAELASHLSSFAGATIVITHSIDDVVALAHRALVLEQGEVTHNASVTELLAAPTTRYAQQLVNGHRSDAG